MRQFVQEYVDIVFANEEEAFAFTGLKDEQAADFLSQLTSIAIVKLGKRGSIIQSGSEIIHIKLDPLSAVDTTGAGDLYAAGFLYGYIHNYSLENCGKIGSICAGKVIQLIGAKIPTSQWTDIKQQISELIN